MQLLLEVDDLPQKVFSWGLTCPGDMVQVERNWTWCYNVRYILGSKPKDSNISLHMRKCLCKVEIEHCVCNPKTREIINL